MSIGTFARALALGAFAACCAGATQAQTRSGPHGTVVGLVVDGSTGAPLSAVEVRLVPFHRAELTGPTGRFVLGDVAPGKYTLVVERLGYRSASIAIDLQPGSTREVRVEMDVSALQLGGLVVATGALSARDRDDVLSPVSSISGADLDRLSNQTLAAMIDGQPGLAQTSLGPVTARPVIRGLGGDRILVLEDGARPGDLSAMSSDHAVAIEPLTAKQVDVVRGPMSLMYGSNALGGVVNVIRGEIPADAPEGTHGAMTLQGASVNSGVTGAGYATSRIGRFAFRAEGTARTFGDLNTPGGPLVHTGGDTYDGAVGIGLPGAHAHVGASYRYYANDYGIPGGFIGGHATGVDIGMRRHTFRGEAGFHPEGGLISSVSVTGGYTNYHHEELEPSGNLGTSFAQDLFQGEVVAHHAARGPLREGALGFRGQYRDLETGGTLKTPSTWDYSLAGFLIEELGPDVFRIQMGLRYDYARYTPRDTTSFVTAGGERIPVRTRDFGSASASVGALWTPTDILRFGASVSRAYRTPDLTELYSNGPHLADNSFNVGDPSLRQETGVGFDVFARLTHHNVHGEIAAYRNTLDDYVFPSSRGRAELGAQGGRPRFQYTNEDARFTGLEGEILASLSDAFRVEASASMVRAEFTSDRASIPVFDGPDTTFVDASQYPPLIPPAQGRVGLRMEKPGVFAGVGLKGVARQGRTGDFESETAGYALVDLTAGVRLVRGGTLHTITLRVDNALDQEYRDHLSRVKDIIPGPGRGVSLLYRFVF